MPTKWRYWTEEEDEYIKNNYGKVHIELMCEFLNRSEKSVRARGQFFKIQVYNKPVEFIIIDDKTYHIPIKSKGEIFYAIIDSEDFHKIENYWWNIHRFSDNLLYARSMTGKTGNFMHNLILNPIEGFKVDHKNRNGLDNRKENLRLANTIQSAGNTGPRSNSKDSKYKGVHKNKRGTVKIWIACLCRKNIGYYATEIEAAKAYDKAAYERYGEFAYLNFPEDYHVRGTIAA